MKLTTEEAMKNPVLKRAIEAAEKGRHAPQVRECTCGAILAEASSSKALMVIPACPVHGLNINVGEMPKAKAKGRTKPRGTMNKLETAFSLYLESEKQAGRVLNWSFESETFKIGHDCRYTPDFACLMAGHFESYFEVKGPHAWEDSLIKLKVVAAKWWWRTFFLVKRNKDGTWKILEVKAA